MFFADALLARRFTDLFATHPPLEARIRQIDPHWDGTFPQVKPLVADEDEPAGPEPARLPRFLPGLPGLPGVSQVPVLGLADQRQPAEPAPSRPLPPALRTAAREPFSARSLVYALVLDRRPAARQAQLDRLREQAEPAEFQETLRLLPLVEPLAEEARLPLLDLVLPALRTMSPAQSRGFRARVEMLATVDHQLSVFEYSLLCVLSRRLDESSGRHSRPVVRYRSPRSLQPYMVQVLTLLAWEGNESQDRAQAAFRAGLSVFLGQPTDLPLPVRETATLRTFHAALRRCDQSVPGLKQRVVEACAACILADRQVTARENELFRAVCAVLGVPMPPLPV